MITATRYHDISAGHRVMGHEGKCALLHGHNYRIHFTVRAETIDPIGRVIDFSVVKDTLCGWLELNWDHRFLMFVDDFLLDSLRRCDPEGVVAVPFNPTAENMAAHLLELIGPKVLPEHITLVAVTVEETRKCSATATFDGGAAS